MDIVKRLESPQEFAASRARHPRQKGKKAYLEKEDDDDIIKSLETLAGAAAAEE